MVHASGPRYTQELQRASGIAIAMVMYTCVALEGKGLLVRRRVRHTSPEYRGERRGLGSWLWSTTPEAELMLAHDPCPEAPVEPLPYMPHHGPRPVGTSTDMEILRAMGDEPVSVARLMTSLRRSDSCIYTHLHRLEASGDVRKYWDGERYQWVVA